MGWVLIYFSAELSALGFPLYLIVIPASFLIIASAIEFTPRLFVALRDKWRK